MVDATISRFRMRDLARPGRYRTSEASSITAALPSRPDLVASTIFRAATVFQPVTTSYKALTATSARP
jgi:hypothetical protein